MARRACPIPAVQRNGWSLVLHPAFRDAISDLAAEVEALAEADPSGAWRSHDKAKLLARIVRIVLDEVPVEPGHPRYEQGNTLGPGQRGWRRAKFLQRFRLFFRFDTRHKVIIYAWVNDEATLRKAGARTDPCRVFRGMLESGDPPADWDALLEACRAESPEGSPSQLLGPSTPLAVTEPLAAPHGPRKRARKPTL